MCSSSFGITADQVRQVLDEQGIIGAVQWLYEALDRDTEMLGKVIERTEGFETPPSCSSARRRSDSGDIEVGGRRGDRRHGQGLRTCCRIALGSALHRP